MAKREPLKLPGTFEDALSSLLRTPPPPKVDKPKPTTKPTQKRTTARKKVR